MKEDLITFETAKLAKEKGFDIPTRHYYGSKLNKDGIYQTHHSMPLTHKSLRGGGYLKPTQSLLQKWLREKHNTHIKIHSLNSDRFGYEIYDMIFRYKDNRGGKHLHNKKSLITYEEALEKGLLEALKLIQDGK